MIWNLIQALFRASGLLGFVLDLISRIAVPL